MSAMITLVQVGIDSPCHGHLCDQCMLCRTGECCRRDSPEQLPPPAWTGPIFGTLGVILEEAGKIECHACGEWFKSLPRHIFYRHRLWIEEYKELFDLNRTCSLVGSETKSKLSVALLRSRSQGKMLGSGLPTPEQLSQLIKGKNHRKQGLLAITNAAQKRSENSEWRAKISYAKTRSNPIRVCPQCSRPFKRTFRRKKYCSPLCGKAGAAAANKHPVLTSTCVRCGCKFDWQSHPSHLTRKYCSRLCGSKKGKGI